MSNSLILIASDHRGISLKAEIISWLKENKFEVQDLGTNTEDRCDASDYAIKLAAELKTGADKRGILICGTGQVMAMTSNRFRHIRAALCTNSTMARMARQHNDANVLVLGAHVTGIEVARDCVDVFLGTDFLGGRYADRCKKLTDMGGL